MVSWNETGACSGDECGPRLIGFLDCNNVELSNITLNQTAYCCFVFLTNIASSFNQILIPAPPYSSSKLTASLCKIY